MAKNSGREDDQGIVVKSNSRGLGPADDAKDCVVTVATGLYLKGQERLLCGLRKVGYAGAIMAWADKLPPDSPPQEVAPMGFKPHAMSLAIEEGSRYVLWLDANYIPVRRLDRIFRKIDRDGYYIYSLGSSLGEWCSDIALSSFGITREKALSILEINSSCIGLDAENSTARRFLEDWQSFADDGKTFRGIDRSFPLSRTNDNRDGQVSSDPRVRGHRHDQSCASFLAWKYRMHLSSMEIVNYQHLDERGDNVYSSTIPFTASLLQNRDTKRDDDRYLVSVDKYGNSRGLRKWAFMLRSFVATIKKSFRGAQIERISRNKGYYSA